MSLSRIEILHSDCLSAMLFMEDNSVDSIVTDPPYGLGFMGKQWDTVAPGVDFWAEMLRILKPGGHLLSFGGSRTYHRMASAIEDAGFEIRDQIMWVYGSGFPKSLDVSKAIDKAAGVVFDAVPARGVGFMNADGAGGYNITKNQLIRTGDSSEAALQWQGWGTALKPAHEPIVMARKPLAKGCTVAANVLLHGTGALNIDGCRIGDFKNTTPSGVDRRNAALAEAGYRPGAYPMGDKVPDTALGRWPANLIHDGSDEVLAAFLDAKGQPGDVSDAAPSDKTSNVYGAMKRTGEASQDSDNEGAVGFKMKPGARRLDAGSAARFFYAAKAGRKDRNEGCEQMDKKPLLWSSGTQNPGSFQAEGTDRSSQNNHPTVKPTDLMAYLCRLVTPPGGVVLDPFMGSGSTGKAAVREGFKFIGIEREAAYVDIARARIDHELSKAGGAA